MAIKAKTNIMLSDADVTTGLKPQKTRPSCTCSPLQKKVIKKEAKKEVFIFMFTPFHIHRAGNRITQ